jgi:hypothetical protein
MRSTSRSVGSLLGLVPGLKAISVQLDLIAAMQQACTKALPKPLSEHVRVAFLDGQTLVLEVDSGVLAARVKHLAARLLATMRPAFPQLTGIRCEVRMPHRTRVRQGRIRRIEPTGKAALTQLAGSLPGGELKAAVERLLQGQARSDRENEALQGEEGESHRSDD